MMVMLACMNAEKPITFSIQTCVPSTGDNHQSDEWDCGDIQFWYKKIHYTKRYMQNYIDSCHEELESCSAYPE